MTTTAPRRDAAAPLDTILDYIGNTPLVRINALAKNLKCELYAKCEFFNPGGSIKDRVAHLMVQEAEASGRLQPGDTLIEPTSGNTGIGLALAAAVKGYRCIIVLPEKMSQEKVNVLKALGAEIVRTPTEAAWDSPDSHISVARRLNAEIPHSHILDQYTNPANPGAHYTYTAEELLAQCNGKIDMLVAGAGTGGTITGIGKKLKEHFPDIIIVGVDPVGSILAQPSSLNDTTCTEPYQIEGIGYDFIPAVLDRSLVNVWEKSTDTESFVMARRMIREEGLLCGGSCGSAMAAALKHAATLVAGQTCVVILPDSTRNYMTKFLSDEWMGAHGHVSDTTHTRENYKTFQKELVQWWSGHPVSTLPLAKAPTTIGSTLPCSKALEMMQQGGFDQLPVVNEAGTVVGVMTLGNLLTKVTSGTRLLSDSVASTVYKTFATVRADAPLSRLAKVFDTEYFALVTDLVPNDVTAIAVVTRIDLLNYITTACPPSP